MFHNRSFSLKPVNSSLNYKMLFSCRLITGYLPVCQLARSTFGNCRQHQSISHFLRLLIELGVPQDSPPFFFRHFSLMYIHRSDKTYIKNCSRTKFNCSALSKEPKVFEKYQLSKPCIVKSREAIRFVLHSLHC